MTVAANTTNAHWAKQPTFVVPQRRTDLIEEVLDGQAILVDPDSGTTHRLNETALDVWHRCDGRTTTRQIAEKLMGTFDVDFETAVDHVEQLVSAFGQMNLFQPAKDS